MGQVTINCRAGLGQLHLVAVARPRVRNDRTSRCARSLTPSSPNIPGMKRQKKKMTGLAVIYTPGLAVIYTPGQRDPGEMNQGTKYLHIELIK